MIDSYEIQNSVIKWLKIIESKNFAGNGMLLRMKITFTIWQYKKTFSIRATDGFIRTSKVPILCKRRTDLTSNKHCQLCSNWNKEGALQTPTNSHRNQQWAQSSSSWWQGSWWTPYFYESHDGDEPSTDRMGWLVIQVIGTILQRMIFLNSITLLQMDRLQQTSVYCNRRRV